MKQSYLLTSSLFLLFACAACEEDDKMDMDKIDVPNGYALSAGTSTIFLNSSVAYDTNADWITGANSIRFNNGDGLYDDVRTSNNGDGGGLGPVYAGYSCGSCHRNAGRTKPTLWENGGAECLVLTIRFVNAGLYLPPQRCFLPRLRTCIARPSHLRRQTGR